MKNRKKKEKISTDAKLEKNFANVIEGLTEALTEELSNENIKSMEPFEQYAQKVRGRMHADFNTFRSRFVKGYNALLEEIVHEQESQTKHLRSKSY